MTDEKRRRLYYQGAADGYMIAGALAVQNSRISGYEPDSTPALDIPDLVLIAQAFERIIARGPARFHHVIEDSPSLAPIWRQLTGE